MAKRKSDGRTEGFYKMLVSGGERECVEDDESRLEVKDGDDLEGVYLVERVVERRRVKGLRKCFVLWKGYRREEATWVREEDVTAAALRTFTEPQLPERVVLDAVSSLVTAIKNSLKVGTVRCFKFNVNIRRDVFNYLFNNRGSSVCRRQGKFYNRSDFNDSYFCNNNFVFRNQYGEGVCVEFPIYMCSFVKFIKLDNSTDFCEIVSVTLIKKCC